MEKNLNKIIEDINLLRKIESGAWVVRNVGKAVMLSSGKSVWKREQHAKSALTNHLATIYHRGELQEWGFKDAKELSQYLQNSGILKVEQV